MPNHQVTIHQNIIIKKENKKRPNPYTNRTLPYSVYRKRIRIFVGTTDYTDWHRLFFVIIIKSVFIRVIL